MSVSSRRPLLVELPMHVAPPTAEAVAASAHRSPLLATLTRLRRHLGPNGLALGPGGRLTFPDSASLAEMLGLPVVIDPCAPPDEAEPVSPDPVPRLTLALAVAVESGAVDEVDGRLVPAVPWEDETEVVRAAVALDTLLELGPMWTSLPRGEPFLDLRDTTLDSTLVNWLATLLPEGRVQRVDHFVNWGIDVCREQLAIDSFPRRGEFDLWVDNGTCYLIDTLAWAGAIDWIGSELRECELEPGTKWFGGGSIRLTALGRHVLPDHLADAGIKLRPPDTEGEPSAAGLLGDILVTQGADACRALVARWRPELADADRARLIVEVLLDATESPLRTVGFMALEHIGPEVAAPYVRQLLDSPSAETAAQFLVNHDLASAEQMQPFLGFGPLIDALATLVGQPDRLRRWFVHALEQCEAPELLLEVIALYPTPEATMLLTAAARHVTDPRFANLIGAAEQCHRTVMAERDPAL